VSARVSMSDVSSSIRRCTIAGCAGMDNVGDRIDLMRECGSIVIANNDGRGRCEFAPSRRMSPYIRSAWMSGTSSMLKARDSSWSEELPSASSPETIVSQASCGGCSDVRLSGDMAS